MGKLADNFIHLSQNGGILARSAAPIYHRRHFVPELVCILLSKLLAPAVPV
jgi:hypothetical protein